MPESITHHFADIATYWITFWTFVNILLPPREWFADCSPKTINRYNLLLKVIAYYGALNLRQISVKVYGTVPRSEQPKDDK